MKKTIKYILGYLKCTILRVGKFDKKVYIGRNVHIVNPKNLIIGERVSIRPEVDIFVDDKISIGNECDIGTRNRFDGNIIIEDEVLFGPDNYICSKDHNYENIEKSIMKQGASAIHKNGHNEIKIGKGSWIGTHVAIIGDVHVGKHCVIGANSVVTKDVPDYSVAIGIPAKVIKKYNFEIKKWEKVR